MLYAGTRRGRIGGGLSSGLGVAAFGGNGAVQGGGRNRHLPISTLLQRQRSENKRSADREHDPPQVEKI
ncbi:MAG: hypothetical protein AAGJ55_09350 [Cyanobacteria bacterium J06555_12]